MVACEKIILKLILQLEKLEIRASNLEVSQMTVIKEKL